MKRQILWKISVLLCLMLSGCLLAQMGCAPGVQVPPQPEPAVQPLVRVAIIQDTNQVSFDSASDFRVVDDRGQVILSSGSRGLKWAVRVKFGQPASTVYRLVLYEEGEMSEAQQNAAELKELGFQPKIVVVGRQLHLGTRVLNDNRKYWVTIGPYATEEEASSQGEILPQDLACRVIPEVSAPPLGALDLVNPFGKVVLSSGEPFSLVANGSHKGLFTLYGVPVGTGFSWERQEERTYRGSLEFRLGNDGRILAVNELPLEDYLKGVLPKEMSPSFPPAALRAQAIAARSYTIAKLGIQHRLEPFDLCADVHCQAYAGAGSEHPLTNQVVDQTNGQVLIYNGQVCEGMYSAVCGGHTESSVNVWGGSPTPYLVGKLDMSPGEVSPFPEPMDSEESVRTWVTSTPPAFCNHLSENAPATLHYTRRYFRWIFTYSRQELEQVISDKTGKKIGNLLDIVPVSRGLSGRLMKVRIVGDVGEVVVERELKIRHALSPSYLPSACFVVDKEMGPDGLPAIFYIRGAGWGHGVGMCQAGAAGMALQGLKHWQILSHYYEGAQISKIYGALF